MYEQLYIDFHSLIKEGKVKRNLSKNHGASPYWAAQLHQIEGTLFFSFQLWQKRQPTEGKFPQPDGPNFTQPHDSTCLTNKGLKFPLSPRKKIINYKSICLGYIIYNIWVVPDENEDSNLSIIPIHQLSSKGNEKNKWLFRTKRTTVKPSKNRYTHVSPTSFKSTPVCICTTCQHTFLQIKHLYTTIPKFTKLLSPRTQ